MMDRETIEFNYERTIKQAEEIESLASTTVNIADQDISGCLQNLFASWKGDNSVDYIAKVSPIVGNTERLSSYLSSISGTIKMEAQNIREAELEALRIEEERAYLARLEEERLLREKEKSAKAKSIIKKSKGVIAFLIILLSLSGTLSGCVNSMDDFYDKPIVLTEKEKDLMRHVVDNEANLERGTLWKYEKDEVLEIRNMTAYLKKKYPSYDIEITHYSPSFPHPLFPQNYSSFELEYAGREYEATISSPEDEDPYYADNFYVYLLQDDYNKWVEELLLENGYSVRVYTWFLDNVGEELDENSCLDDLLSISEKIDKWTFVYFPGEVDKTACEGVRQVFLSNGIYGRYEIFFTGDDESVTVNTVFDNRRQYGSILLNDWNDNWDTDKGDKTNADK